MTSNNTEQGESGTEQQPEPLKEVGPYEDDDLPYMNFECPECGASFCEETVCPGCGWHDRERWDATMEHYSDCNQCQQTIRGEGLCEECAEEVAA